MEAATEEKEENETLLKDINKLYDENGEEKNLLLKDLIEKNRVLNDKNNIIEEKNQKLEEENKFMLRQKKHDDDKFETVSLEDELCQSDDFFSVKTFDCKDCEAIFSCRDDLGKHIKIVHVASLKVKL